MALGCLMKSLLADFGTEVGTEHWSEVRCKRELRSSQTPQQRALLLNAKGWDDRSTSTSDGCGCKTRCFLRKRQYSNPQVRLGVRVTVSANMP
eukprot:4544268-Amphidinium_carterae.1